jgi:serine/threonine protein kinase/tetratricopeptide (TPR) repeat protein
MGEVYRARDPRLGRDVAVKALPQHLANDPDALARFEREARAVAALSHPNILAIYDVGTDRGLTYAVMELLEGETLRSRLARGALPWRDAAEIGAAIADGLSTAHAKGIVHRDLKPDNIFLTTDGRPKVLDFGLASHALTGPADTETVPATRTNPGTVMGTVGYMSPEQVRGQPAGAAADMFSLGCVLYEMVAGRPPFARETAAQTMTAILEQAPAPLSTANTPVPRELDRVIARCLEKHPGARMQSARDLAFTLRNVARGSSVANAAPSRSRVGVKAVVAAALSLLVASSLGVVYYRYHFAATNSIAILPFVNASGNPDMEYLGDGITETLINSLAQAPNLTVMSRNAVFRYKGRDSDAQEAGARLNVEAVLTGRVVQRGDDLSISAELVDVRSNRQLWGEQFNRRAGDILAVQEEISNEISQKLRLRLTGEQKQRLVKGYTQNAEAYQLYLKGRYYWNKKTADGFNKGLDYFEKALALDPNFAPAYAALATCYTNLANYNFALIPPQQAWAKAKAAARKAVEIDDALAAGHGALAIISYQWEWDWPNAEKEFQRAIALDPGSASTYEPSPSSTLHWYSHLLMTMRRTQESFVTGRQAFALEPLDLANNAHQGWYYLWTREYDRAIEPLNRAVAMDPTFPVPQWYLGLVYEQKGMHQEAIEQFQNCVRITAGRPSMLALLGHAYAVAGRQNDAQAILDQLHALLQQRYVPSYSVAAIYAALGRKDEAFTWLERAYDERDSWMDYLALDPRLDPLRSDARFATLLQRINVS